jgi:hypothetical protein
MLIEPDFGLDESSPYNLIILVLLELQRTMEDANNITLSVVIGRILLRSSPGEFLPMSVFS